MWAVGARLFRARGRTVCADALGPPTVDGHMRNVYGKLHVHTRGEVVAKALRERLV